MPESAVPAVSGERHDLVSEKSGSQSEGAAITFTFTFSSQFADPKDFHCRCRQFARVVARRRIVESYSSCSAIARFHEHPDDLTHGMVLSGVVFGRNN
jgi:hypothetical protein